MIARIVAHVVALSLFGLGLASAIFAAETPEISLENNFVRVVVNKGPDEAGRFSIKTTNGDPARPTSKGKHLIFGGNVPWTSYTTLLLDGEKWGFGSKTERRAGKNAKYSNAVVVSPTTKDDAVITAYQYGDIEVAQELTLARGISTRMMDTIGITYKITNTGNANHTIGLRVMLDTMCGSNDGAPIRSGEQEVTTVTAVTGEAIPQFWMAFDNLADPTVISQGTLWGGKATKPDKVIFADWGSFADEAWEPALVAGQGFVRKGEADPDTAAAMYWNPLTIEPGQTRVITTYYGMGYLTPVKGTLGLSLTRPPEESIFAHERTEPFTIYGFLQNTGDFEARDVKLSFVLPEGLDLISGSALTRTIASLKPKETAQASWVLRPNGKLGGKQKLKLFVTSENIEPNDTMQELDVLVPAQKLVVTPASQKVSLETSGGPTIIPIMINLTPAEQFHGVRFTLAFNRSVVKPIDVSRGPAAFVDNDRLLPGWKFDLRQVDAGKVVITGRRTNAAPITASEIELAKVIFRTVDAGKSALTLESAFLINEKGVETPVDVAAGAIEVVAEP